MLLVNYWISILLTSESLTALIVSPLAGYYTDAYGRRHTPFLFGLFSLAVSMLVIATSHSILHLVLGRCLQGASTAIVTISGMALVLDEIPSHAVAVTLGWLSSATTAGFTVGPALGGVLYRYGGWWTVFGTIFGVLLVDLLLRLSVVKETSLEVLGAAHSSQTCEDVASTSKRSFAFVVLLRQKRVRIMLWGVLVSGIIVSSFDAVSMTTS